MLRQKRRGKQVSGGDVRALAGAVKELAGYGARGGRSLGCLAGRVLGRKAGGRVKLKLGLELELEGRGWLQRR